MALEQPKKPVGGAFGIFMSEKRPEFLKQLQGQKASAVSTMASEAWKKVSQKDKDVYQKKYEDAKAKFDKDMEAFKAAGGEVAKGVAGLRAEKRKEKEGKKKKDANAPKRPQSAYSVFLSENREAILKSLPAGANPITDVAKKAGEQWKALSANAKKPYETTAEKLKAEYQKAMEEYKKTQGNDAADDDDEAEAEEKPKKKARKAGA
eukprot:TRINITY_DN1096_c0_g1_i1.p1 TRINITY_DN1096_c0_g1~~TRINITY_DN1096_c0_g1_i1.p1  ORF type:complete len:227 (-),score=98.18 TRINITY_DN1096_c0_g1_i1:145-765(-)